jgi:hypothetical protein
MTACAIEVKVTVMSLLRQAGICKDRTLLPNDTELDSDELSDRELLSEIPVLSDVELPEFIDEETPEFSEVELPLL